MLQLGFLQALIASLAQITDAKRLSMRPFNARPLIVEQLPFRGVLFVANALKRLVLGLVPDAEMARFLLGAGALGTNWAQPAIGARKLDFHDLISPCILKGHPTLTHLALGTDSALVLPID